MDATISTAEPTSLKTWIQQHPLLSFFLLVPGFTWPFLIVDALGSHALLPFRLSLPLLVLTGYMPTLAAVVVTALTEGKAGVRALLGRLFIARVGLQWYGFAIFGFGLVCAGAVLLYNLIPGHAPLPLLSPDTPPFSGPLQFAVNILVVFVIAGLINGEELAWRGFALPRLQARHTALTASLILGLNWALFHLPLFFTLTGSAQANMSWVSFTLSTLALTVLFTWMYNHTRGSVLMAYLLHAACNTWTVVFAVKMGGVPVNWIMTGLVCLAAAAVLAAQGAENLSRGGRRVTQ